MITLDELTGQNLPSIHVEPRAVVRWDDATPARVERESLAETQARIDAIMAEYARVSA